MEQEYKGIYIFCGIQKGKNDEFGEIELEGEKRELFLISFQDSAIVAAEVPMKIFHPNKENVMMHQKVLSHVMKQNNTVIPVSFGNVFHSKEDVEVLLENLYPQFKKLFPEIKGKMEVGLKVVGKKEWLESQIKDDEQIGKLAESVRDKSEAASYYERIQLGGAAQKMIQSLQNELKQEVFNPLKDTAVAAKANDPIGEKMLLNAAFLIDQDKEAEFDLHVNQLHDKWEDKVEFAYSGPWPAYNFVNIKLKVDEA